MNCIFRFLAILILILSFNSCKSTATLADLNALKEVVKNKNIEFVANAANPMAISGVTGLESLLPVGSNLANINLIGNQNYLIIKNDSIKFHMPYYGVRRLGGQYGTSDNGLSFKGIVKHLETKFNPKKNSYKISCRINKSQENLELNLTMYANKSATLQVNSSHRNAINYTGNWQTE
ncbi:DUF4251 domain-containing protein [Polaribacter sp. M15]